MQVSYDFYDDMCFALSELGGGDAAVPPWDLIRKLERLDPTLTLGYFSYICENADAETDDEKKRIAYINKVIREHTEFYEGDEPPAKTWDVPEDDYFSCEKIADECIDCIQNILPSKKAVKERIAPNIRFCYLLAYCFYRKALKEDKKTSAEQLKRLITKNFCLKWADKPVEITETELKRLEDDVSGTRYGDVEWLPTVAEVLNYIVPNFSISYDFVLWLIKKGPEPKTREEKKSVMLLKEILHKKIRILDKNGGRLQTIWS